MSNPREFAEAFIWLRKLIKKERYFLIDVCPLKSKSERRKALARLRLLYKFGIIQITSFSPDFILQGFLTDYGNTIKEKIHVK